jgi:succinoglycan biosynthesis transport protein ExoP
MSRALTRQKKASPSAGQLWEMVKRRGEIVTVSGVLLATIGIAGVSLLPDVYRATTTILVDPQKIPEKYVSSTVTSDPNARMNTLSQQVLSASRLQEIIDKNNLYPELRKKKSREEVLDLMREKTKIELKQSPEPEQGLSSFTISYEDSNRALVALIANQLASSFIDWNLRIRQQQALGTTHFLSSELQQAKESLEEQESQREAFKMKHAGATPEELNGNLLALSRLQSDMQSNLDAISRLDQERILLARARPMESQTLPATERDRLLLEKRRLETERWNLKRQFTNSYPDVVAADEQLAHLNARLAELPAPAPDSLESSDPDTQVRLALVGKEIARHKQRISELQQSMRTYQWKVDSVPVLETQMAELSRNYDSSKQNYQSLLEKTFSAGMAEELERTQQAERFTVLDLAKTPEKPIRPKRVPILAGVLFAALLLPAGTAIGLFLLRGAVGSEAEMRDMLPIGIPILGTIPPIVSRSTAARQRWKKLQTVVVSLAACAALAIFLFKVRPTL